MSTTDGVEAAAERLRRDEYTDAEYLDGIYDSTDKWDDQKIASAAYLELTDPTPIDETWLRRKCGFHDFGPSKALIRRIPERPFSVGYLEWIDGKLAQADWLAPDGSLQERFIFPQQTRGTVRMLCRVLGIELKESDI